MLVFHENPNHPVAFVSMQDLALSTLFEVLESHKFLTLPRLSNQAVLDQLCPTSESSNTRKKLCVVLINTKQDDDSLEEAKRSHLRHFINKHSGFDERVKFAYIFKEVQTHFVQALSNNEDNYNLAILWRKESKKLKYEWFRRPWTENEDNKTQEELKEMLKKLLSDPNETALSHEAVLQELLDEHAASLFIRMLTKITETWDFLKENLTKDEVLPLSLIHI